MRDYSLIEVAMLSLMAMLLLLALVIIPPMIHRGVATTPACASSSEWKDA